MAITMIFDSFLYAFDIIFVAPSCTSINRKQKHAKAEFDRKISPPTASIIPDTTQHNMQKSAVGHITRAIS
jgi:hypothetical protein